MEFEEAFEACVTAMLDQGVEWQAEYLILNLERLEGAENAWVWTEGDRSERTIGSAVLAKKFVDADGDVAVWSLSGSSPRPDWEWEESKWIAAVAEGGGGLVSAVWCKTASGELVQHNPTDEEHRGLLVLAARQAGALYLNPSDDVSFAASMGLAKADALIGKPSPETPETTICERRPNGVYGIVDAARDAEIRATSRAVPVIVVRIPSHSTGVVASYLAKSDSGSTCVVRVRDTSDGTSVIELLSSGSREVTDLLVEPRSLADAQRAAALAALVSILDSGDSPLRDALLLSVEMPEDSAELAALSLELSEFTVESWVDAPATPFAGVGEDLVEAHRTAGFRLLSPTLGEELSMASIHEMFSGIISDVTKASKLIVAKFFAVKNPDNVSVLRFWSEKPRDLLADVVEGAVEYASHDCTGGCGAKRGACVCPRSDS